MSNAELFKKVFGIYAEEFWAYPEEKMLDWLTLNVPDTNVGDTISRQAAIERATEEHDFFKGARTPTDKARRDELLNVMCWLGELPSAQSESRWIPVEEDMPEFGERVLVTKSLVDGSPWVRIAWYGIPMFETNVCFYESDSEWGDCEISGVIAWMPLQKPYERSKDE